MAAAARRALREFGRLYKGRPGLHCCRCFGVPSTGPAGVIASASASAAASGTSFPSFHGARRSLAFPGEMLREELQNLARDRLCGPATGLHRAEGRRLEKEEEDLGSKLRSLSSECVSVKECVSTIVMEENLQRTEAEKALAALARSGRVLVLGDRVFLRPEKITKEVLECVLPILEERKENEALLREEYAALEKQKKEIDAKAEEGVRREMWMGLGVMCLQSLALMRLTFWDLSWDVMEPICFFLTNAYFYVGYSFFLKTKTQPTLDALYKARFKAKQRRLMKKQGFDFGRFLELRNQIKNQQINQRRIRIPSGGILDAV